MKRSIASVCLSGDLRQKIEAVAEAGYDGIEIFENRLYVVRRDSGYRAPHGGRR